MAVAPPTVLLEFSRGFIEPSTWDLDMIGAGESILDRSTDADRLANFPSPRRPFSFVS
jgi:hypothetical protein